MVWWILIGIALLILLVVVSLAQRIGEYSRRLRTARALQGKLADAAVSFQSETEFSEVFQSGEAAELARRTRSQVDEFLKVLADANRKLAHLQGPGRWLPTLDRTVEAAKVMEVYEHLEKQISAVQGDISKLNALVKRAGVEADALQKDFAAVRQQVASAVEQMPASWQTEWTALDAKLTRLSAETDEAKRARAQSELRDALTRWRTNAERINLWADWRAHGEERQSIMEACLQRLTALGGQETTTVQALSQADADIRRVVNASPEQAVEDALEGAYQRLGVTLTGLLNRATRLLHLLGNPTALPAALAEQAGQLRAMLDWWRAEEATILLRDLRAARPSSADAQQKRLEAWRTQALDWIRSADESHPAQDAAVVSAADGEGSPAGTGAPPETAVSAAPEQIGRAVQRADALLTLLDEGAELRRTMEKQLALARQTKAERHARIQALERHIADALSRLAGANLGSSDEARKWSDWQGQMTALSATVDSDASDKVADWEQRIHAEQAVVDALVTAQTDVDAMLQAHLDRLTQRHGGDIPESDSWRHEQARRHLDNGDLTSAAWTSLAMAEMMAETATWDAWTPW